MTGIIRGLSIGYGILRSPVGKTLVITLSVTLTLRIFSDCDMAIPQ